MLQPDPAALNFLRTRRSHPPSTLSGPGPSAEGLADLLAVAARVPDHGKLEPWRFIVLRAEAGERIAVAVEAASLAQGNPPEKARKHGDAFRVPVVVAVVSRPVDSTKVPEWEQFLSAGAVCLSLVNAALAAGFGASWLTGVATEGSFAQDHLGLGEGERIAGFVHIGQPGPADPPDRPRPDVAALTTELA